MIVFNEMKQGLILLLILSFFFAKDAEAKVLPQAKGAFQKSNSVVRKPSGSGIGAFPKLRADRRALIINFTNLQNATAVSYLLRYKSAVQEEGAMGALNLNGASNSTQELLFGTCSKNVCRYHTGIKDAKLEISYTLKTGKKYLKKYRIRV